MVIMAPSLLRSLTALLDYAAHPLHVQTLHVMASDGGAAQSETVS